MEKKLCKGENKMIAGVCAGISEHYNLDLKLVRIITVVTGVFGLGGLAYLIAMFVLPAKPTAS